MCVCVCVCVKMSTHTRAWDIYQNDIFRLGGYVFVQLFFSVSNWQKVQLNTDLFSDVQKYFYKEKLAY